MKHFNFWALALTAIIVASCTSEDDLTLSPPANQAEEETMSPIMFTSSQSAFTRAKEFTGAEAAEKLNKMFVVTGFKSGDVTTTPTTAGSTAGAGTIVFDNYKVEYAENTANTTESNSSNWEYVGKERIQHAIDNGITQQTIKYWDYTKTQYDFIAWGMGKLDDGTPIVPIYTDADLTGHQVRVSAIAPNGKSNGWPTGSDPTRPSYTFEGTSEDLAHCYISDLVTVYKDAKTGTDETYNVVYKGYQQPVTLKFRQLGTKVRIGIYETVPGYSVKDVKFYNAAKTALENENEGTDEEKAAAKTANASAKIFTTVTNGIYKEGTYTIYFPTVDSPTNADNNQAHIKFAPKSETVQKTTVDWGGLNYTFRESGETSTEAKYLGRASNDASYAGNAADNYYVIYLPNQDGTNLNLRVNYTLESIDGSGEEIVVKGATAQVPSIYTAWKPGFAYTYLFKISDKTNGYTGAYDPTKPDDTSVNSDPAGLYPITFDAVVVNAEDGGQTQETITLVSTPSITTYQNGSNVINKNEYTVLSSSDPKITGEIYVTVNDGNEEETPDLEHSTLVDLTGKAALYTITDGKTEAEVVDALQLREDITPDGVAIKGRSGLELRTATLNLTDKVQYGADGNEINLTDGEKKKAAKFTPTANTTYAFVYTKKEATGTATKKYQAKTFASGASVNGYYRYTLTAAASGDVEKGVTYFKDDNASTPAITAFLGQTVDNLFTRSGAGTGADPYVYTPARGYAQTGTTYYYTIDNGKNYIAASKVDYANFKSTPLFYKDGNDWKSKTEEEPEDGRAYYLTSGDYTKYCVIYPQRTSWTESETTKHLYVFNGTDTTDDNNFVACGSTDVAVKGMTYFDMYTKNNGVYYVKIIKVE